MTSRLARNRKEANLIIDLIEYENIQVLSMNESYDD
jgi:DNA invertase Pin-like site-specific DNA recombinase